MPGKKKAKISRGVRSNRVKRRKQHCTLYESRLGKREHIRYAHVVAGISQCLTALESAKIVTSEEVLSSPIPAARPTAPPVIKRKRPQRPISEFKHPQKKARRIAVDLERACDRVFEDHGICFDDADLPLIQSAVLKSKNGPNMLAKLILPGDQSESRVICLPDPIEVEPKDAQVCLQKLVKLAHGLEIHFRLSVVPGHSWQPTDS